LIKYENKEIIDKMKEEALKSLFSKKKISKRFLTVSS